MVISENGSAKKGGRRRFQTSGSKRSCGVGWLCRAFFRALQLRHEAEFEDTQGGEDGFGLCDQETIPRVQLHRGDLDGGRRQLEAVQPPAPGLGYEGTNQLGAAPTAMELG